MPAPIRAIVLKDWRALPRDLRLMSSLVMPFVMMGFYSFTMLRQPLPEVGGDAAFWVALLAVPLIPFLLALRLSSHAFGFESRCFVLLRAAPVSVTQIMLAKLATTCFPILALTWAATLALGLLRGGSPAQIAVALAMSAWLTAGLAAANLVGGALATNLEAENPLRSVGCLGQAAAFGVSGLFLLASLGLFAWLVLNFLGVLPARFSGWLVGPSLAATVLVSVAVIVGLAWRVARNMEAWEGA